MGGDRSIQQILQGKVIYISFVTELELIGMNLPKVSDLLKVKAILSDAIILPLNELIKDHYRRVRGNYRLKLPDSVIAATSIAYRLPFLSADRQFSVVKDLPLYNLNRGSV
jgi:predicted nucleic acid-binding protein